MYIPVILFFIEYPTRRLGGDDVFGLGLSLPGNILQYSVIPITIAIKMTAHRRMITEIFLDLWNSGYETRVLVGYLIDLNISSSAICESFDCGRSDGLFVLFGKASNPIL